MCKDFSLESEHHISLVVVVLGSKFSYKFPFLLIPVLSPAIALVILLLLLACNSQKESAQELGPQYSQTDFGVNLVLDLTYNINISLRVQLRSCLSSAK